MRPARRKAASQGRSGIKAVPFMIKRARTAARIDMGFQNSHVEASFEQQRCGR